MVGTLLLSGLNQSPHEVFIQIEAFALRVPLKAMQDLIHASRVLQALLIRYMQTLYVQLAGTALANGRATLVQRLSRWLLMYHDRVGDLHLKLTHDFMSLMLGTRTAGVTNALHLLEGEGLIRSTRGDCMIRDRAGLMALVGGFYSALEAEYVGLIS